MVFSRHPDEGITNLIMQGAAGSTAQVPAAFVQVDTLANKEFTPSSRTRLEIQRTVATATVRDVCVDPREYHRGLLQDRFPVAASRRPVTGRLRRGAAGDRKVAIPASYITLIRIRRAGKTRATGGGRSKMKLVLKADRLIDGTGSDPVKDAAVVVKDGRISEVTTQDKLQIGEREDVDVIDVAGGTLMPGFIEMHSHIHCSAQADAYTHITTESNETFIMRGTRAVRAALSSGVTTMRTWKQEKVTLQSNLNQNKSIPPRLLAAGIR